MDNIAVSPMSRRNLREFVQQFRKICGMENELYFPIAHFIEWILPKLGFDYEIVPVGEMGNAYGVTHTSRKVMKIREDVYDGAVEGNPRHRFTLCHELGHFLLHTPDRVSFARGEVPAYMNPEWQANTFAGELMAPYDLVKNMNAYEIAAQCGMSMEAARIQYGIYHKVV